MSQMFNLRARREEIAARQHKDLRVPRWSNPEVWVRYRPLTWDEVRSPITKVEKAKGHARIRIEHDANADILVKACLGVFFAVDDVAYNPLTEEPIGKLDSNGWDVTLDECPRFDPDLARVLGVPGADEGSLTARLICRELFFTDGDMMAQAGELSRWSGFTNQEVDEEFAGE